MAENTAPMRTITLRGASNLRDLGGWPTADGRRVRWRTLFRSDRLSDLAPDDVARLRQLRLAHVVDFRGPIEQRAAPDRDVGATWHDAAIQPTLFRDIQAHRARGEVLTADAVAAMMCSAYRQFVRADTAQFARLFALLLQDDVPLAFHCTAGKDRTGVAAALLLSALDVPRAQVLEDYLLTNRCYRVPEDERGPDLPHDAAAALWAANADYLNAAFDTVEQEFGGLSRYLETELRLGAAQRNALQRRYLE